MNPPSPIVDRLIAYWSAQAADAAEDGDAGSSDPLCRELARELAGAMPRSLLGVLKAEPQRHREALEEMVRDQLGLGPETAAPGPAAGPSRDLGRPAPTTPSATPSAPLPPRRAVSADPPEPDSRPEPLLEAPPVPPAGRSQTQTVSGQGNAVFATGDIRGGFQFTSPAAGKEPPRRAQPADDLPDPDSPIRILFLGANPADSMPLRLD